MNVPAALDGPGRANGGHVWFLFHEPFPAVLARKLGNTYHENMERRPKSVWIRTIALSKSRHTTGGGFSNLIACLFTAVPRIGIAFSWTSDSLPIPTNGMFCPRFAESAGRS